MNQKESEYKFDDLKIPAHSPIAAMFLRDTMHNFRHWKPAEKPYLFDKEALYKIYRQVYEYELKEKIGKTRMRWELVNIHNVSETLFKQYMKKDF